MTRWCDGPIAGFDLETTSVNPFTALPVSYALVRKDGDKIQSLQELINPGVPIPEGATKIHGITTEQAMEGKDLEPTVVWIAQELVKASQQGIPVAGMNLSYDLTIIDNLCRDYTEMGLVERGWSGPALDVYVLDKQIDRYRSGSRKLGALCDHYGVELNQAHTAKADAVACVRLVLKMAEQTQWMGVKTAVELHRLQEHWHDEQLQSLSDYRVEHKDDPIPAEDFGWPIHKGPGEA